jgi:hypothetical protein
MQNSSENRAFSAHFPHGSREVGTPVPPNQFIRLIKSILKF